MKKEVKVDRRDCKNIIFDEILGEYKCRFYCRFISPRYECKGCQSYMPDDKKK